jgi:hypothetical protein
LGRDTVWYRRSNMLPPASGFKSAGRRCRQFVYGGRVSLLLCI